MYVMTRMDAYPDPPLWLRLARTGLSYLAASVAAAVVIVFVGIFVPSLPDMRHPGELAFAALLSLVSTVFVLCFVMPFAALPAIVSVFAMRVSKLPRGWSDAAFGAASGLVIAAIVLAGSQNEEWPGFIMLMAVAGAAGGIVYWRASARPCPPYRGWL